MAIFSTNQNRQLYVAKAYNASVSDASAKGTIGDVKIKDGVMYFKYKGADNTLKSDYITLKNCEYLKVIAAEEMIAPLKVTEVKLDSTINGGLPVTGQDYIFGINFRHWVGMSELDQYYKDAAVHVTSAMDNAEKVLKAMKKELDTVFAREIGASKDSNPYLKFEVSGSGANAKLVITEKPQDWSLGTESQERVLFDVLCGQIYTGGEDVVWGIVEDKTPTKAVAAAGTENVNYIGNGKQIADLEWFCMGERGDQYRMKGWPNYIKTEYLADPDKQYHALEIHHAFTDTGVNSYRSEKDITVVFAKNAQADLIAFVKAIEAAGATVAKSNAAAAWTWS